MATTVQASAEALKTTLAAALMDVAVEHGLPLDDKDLAAVAAEAVFILDERDWRRTPVGQGIRDESYTLPLRLRVFQAGRDRSAATTRRQDIIDAIDDAIQANDELSGTVRHAELTSATGVTGTVDGKAGIMSIADLGVSCTARTVVR